MRRGSRSVLAVLTAASLLTVPALRSTPGAAAAVPHGPDHRASATASPPPVKVSSLPKGVNGELSSRATQPDGEVDVAAESADGRSVVYYFAPPGKTFSGPFTVGPSDLDVQPAMALRPNGEIDILTIYNGHLEYYWNFPGSPFYGPAQIGTDSYHNDFAPQMLARNVNEVDVAAISDSGQLQYFWDFAGQPFQGPAVVQSGLTSGPQGYGVSMAVRPNGELDIVSNALTSVANAANSLNYFWDFPGRPFDGPAPVTNKPVLGEVQALVIRPSGEADVAFTADDVANTDASGYVVADMPGRPFGTPASLGGAELIDSMVVRPNGEDDLMSEPLINDGLSVNYRWGFPGSGLAGPIQVFGGASLLALTSFGVGADGVVRAANCEVVDEGQGNYTAELIYAEDSPGQLFTAYGDIGPGCLPTVVIRP